MKKKFLEDPTFRVPFATSNGVQLVIESFPDPNMSSSRWDAKIIGYDFNDIRTNVYLKDVIRLISDISELENEDESIRKDALSYFDEDTGKLIHAIGGTSHDLERLRKSIFNSRDQVFQRCLTKRG